MNQPEILDLVVVGGGPAGVAAALRSHELGLSVNIVETDAVLRRIREYSKEKLILPNFGGGRLAFPRAGEWIDRLHFDPIDKDELVAAWTNLCRQARIPLHTGLELTRIEDSEDGVLNVVTYGQRGDFEEVLCARHVVLAVGRGVPRSFDIPGDTSGIARRLDDPQRYIGQPACIIGGGTSAAEAVIAVSNAKKAARDSTPVYWSYRGDRLPKVSKALAEPFFEAYTSNGNIHYEGRSEPLLVTAGEDRRDYLILRIDRSSPMVRSIEGRILEFPIEHCLACVGEDLPEAFLTSLGIPMVVGGARARKRMVVNRLLESRRSRVYLIGDLLSQAYLEADDFDADPATFREVRHRGNIKSALYDGIRVAEVIRQRLDGIADADIRLPEMPTESDEPASLPALKLPLPTRPRAETAPEPIRRAWLVHLVADGVDGEEHALDVGSVVTLGRGDCDLSFPDDPLLAPLHATLVYAGTPADADTAILRDGGAENGVFLQLPARRKLDLHAGDLLRAGRQFLLVERDDAGFAVVHYRADGTEAGRHRLTAGTVVLGRKADLVLDADDVALSRRQLALSVDGDRLLAKDLLSVNGTYLRIQGDRQLQHGDRFLVGRQRFAFSTQRDAVLDQGPASATGTFTTPAPTLESTDAADDDGPSVTFQPSGKVCPAAPGQTLLDIAEAHGIAIAAECRSGICGSDPLRIIAGGENLDAGPQPGEAETLEDLCGLEAGPCRLACMARVTGPVVVETLL